MYEQLQVLLGLPIKCTAWPGHKKLPLYLQNGRAFHIVRAADVSFLLVAPAESEQYRPLQLKKQCEKIQEAAGVPVAFSFTAMTRPQRNALIHHGIPFVFLPDQCYLPFMGVALQNHFSARQKTSAQMTPASQMLFLLLLYRKGESLSKSEAAQALHLTPTSITRASAALANMGLIHELRQGKEIRMQPAGTGYAYYQKAAPCLISPVQKTVLSEEPHLRQNSLLAGESALAAGSMLAAPEVTTRACYKGLLGDAKTVTQQPDPLWDDYEHTFRLELWKYDPRLFAAGGSVDPVSLACSLRDVNDERVEEQLQRYLEAVKW